MPALNATSFDSRLGELQDVRTMAIYRGFPLYLETFFFSLFVVLIIVSTYILLARRITKAFIAITLANFVLCAVSWAIDIAILWLELCMALPARLADPSESENITMQIYTIMGELGYAQECFFLLNILVGDCVVLWRAYALWERPRWLLISSCVLVVSSLAFDIFYLVILAGADLPSSAVSLALAGDDSLRLIAKGCAWALTAVANLVAIGLIGYKTWIHWKEVAAIVRGSSRSTLGMLAVVIETGILYLLCWLASVLAGEFVFGTFPYYLNWYFVMPITGMYPTLVIVLVAGRRSQLEKGVTKFSTTEGPAGVAHTSTVQSMQFAKGPARPTGEVTTQTVSQIEVAFWRSSLSGTSMEAETPSSSKAMDLGREGRV